jgi:hypothetical protein
MTATKRRARRIAADEAHAWARNLRLRNHHAKSVLRSLTLYVDGDGVAYVGIPTLADDCELSDDTVRRRLTWLEEIGAITRRPQWIDERGLRNGDGRGKRTSDEFRLMFDADPDAIEARAAGVLESVSREVSPSSQRGLNSDPESVGPAPALGQPSHCGEGLISEPEPESPLKAPQGAERERPQELDRGEPEHFGPSWEAWPGHQAMPRDKALDAFRKLSPAEQRLCRAAIPLYLQMRKQLKRDTVPDFHRWIRSGGFAEFPTASLDQPAGGSNSYDGAGREARALRSLYRFARVPLFETGGKVVYSLPITARLLAFAELPPDRDWYWIDEPGPLAAWSAFLSAHINRARPDISEMGGSGQVKRRGIKAPWPWPPRKDGTLSPTGETSEGDAA